MFKELLSVFRSSDPLRAMEKNFSAMLTLGYEMIVSAGEMFFTGSASSQGRTDLYGSDVRVNQLPAANPQAGGCASVRIWQSARRTVFVAAHESREGR